MKGFEEKKILKAYKAKDNEEIIKYLNKFPNKSYRTNPYIRHLETLIDNGKPTGKYHIIQLKYLKTIFLLGTIVFTSGKRILFFPGFQKLVIPHPKTKNIHEIHHITCEKSMKEGHLKFRNKKTQFPDFLTREINNVYFWFGLTIDKPEVLFKTPKYRELIKFPIKMKKDIERRLSLIEEFYKGSLSFDIGDKEIKQNQFLNFEFFLTPNQNYNTSDFPLGSSNADFHDGETYPSMFINVKDDLKDISTIIRFSILPKNKNNLLNVRKSALFFHYVKPFKKSNSNW
ncbi:hypothetical protein LCGC14_0753800 [marine sediment metagenome]|uniref:Uncharacterized protein n=1 Tax=marine sediment metagenome TaxID=412755 RepID=A0A0F9TA82_9ZZZZ|nr:hypothetical protein [archaeon]